MTSDGEFRVVSPVAMLGYGVDEVALDQAMRHRPHAMGVDAGSTDAGPYKLGTGRADVSASMTERDLLLALSSAREANIPFVIGSAGGAGAEPHLKWTIERVESVLRQMNWSPDLCRISSDVDIATIRQAARLGRLVPVDGLDNSSASLDLLATENAVAQMGPDPIIEALDQGYQIVIAGRAVDSAIFAAPAVRAGFPRAEALHAGEIIECASLCASPGSAREAAMATIRRDGFRIEAMHPDRTCTAASVSSHALYERGDPWETRGPGYTLDLRSCQYRADSDGGVEVSGTALHVRPLTVKVEGVTCVGYRTFVIAGIRDPIEIASIDETLREVERLAEEAFPREWPGVLGLRFIQYGARPSLGRASSGQMKRFRSAETTDLGLVIDVVAATEELSSAVCGFVRATLQHYMYPSIKATGANLAFPFSPSDVSFGPVHEFSAYHELAIEGWQEIFSISPVRLSRRGA